MILGSLIQREIGSRHLGVDDTHHRRHLNQPVVVLRAATLDEWIEDVLQNGGTLTQAEIDRVRRLTSFFYEVSLD